MNQAYACIYPLPPEPPSHPSHPSRSTQNTKMSSLCYTVGSHELPVGDSFKIWPWNFKIPMHNSCLWYSVISKAISLCYYLKNIIESSVVTRFKRRISFSCLIVSYSLRPHGLQPARLLCPWDPPGTNTWVCCPSLLQGIFLTQGSNLGLLHCRWTLPSEPPGSWDYFTHTSVPPGNHHSTHQIEDTK